MAEIIKACIDKVIPLESEELIRALAIRENPANAPQPATPFEIAVETRYLWRPGSALRVSFLNGDPLICKKVEHYAHQWEQYANIQFKFVTSGEAPIRIALITNKGSWSYLGTQALLNSDPRTPTMNYGWLDLDTSEQEYSRVVLHEFGHALGCIHEHQHPANGIPWDKVKAYAYYGKQGWTKEQVDFQVFRRYSTSITQFSLFDPQSIMIYPIPEEITIGDFFVGWNTQLSDTDKAYIGKLYPF